MKVYVLTAVTDDYTSVLAVYSSEEDAVQRAHELGMAEKTATEYVVCEYEVV